MVTRLERPRSKKDLERMLEEVPEIRFPREVLEQYTTPSSIAADMAWRLMMHGVVQDKIVFDLGCGTGRLCVACLLVGARECVCVDIDDKLLEELEKFVREHDLESKVNPVRADVRSLPLRKSDNSIVVMNPPFGTRVKHIDKAFLESASEVSNIIVSLHLSSPRSREYLSRLLLEKGFNPVFPSTYMFGIKQVLPHHRSRIRRVPVDLLVAMRGMSG